MYQRMDSPGVILVIDSDALMLTAVAAVLNLAGYECHCAQGAEAACKAARSLTLDLIVCDVELDDGEDGFELCRELRQVPGCEDVPLIFVSSQPSGDLVRRTHEAGGTYYLRKPYDPDVLLDLAEKALWVPHLINTRIDRHAPSAPHFLAPVAKPADSPAPR